MSQYEIEVKTLLGSKEHADALKQRMCELDAECACVSTNSQLNHYFVAGDIHALFAATQHLFSDEAQKNFAYIAEHGKDFSVRTREKDGTVLLVVKASMDTGTSSNAVTRLEFEESVDAALEALDNLVVSAGFTYQAKWSRDREEYTYKGINVCIDRNAGYGYLAEFEKVITDESYIESARAEIDALMTELGVTELSQDRLERMFTHYNARWQEYYGTDKTFIID